MAPDNPESDPRVVLRINHVCKELGYTTRYFKKLEGAGLIPAATWDTVGRRYTQNDLEALREVLEQRWFDRRGRLGGRPVKRPKDPGPYSKYANHLPWISDRKFHFKPTPERQPIWASSNEKALGCPPSGLEMPEPEVDPTTEE